MSQSISRNDPCPCGSGRKYKNCCAGKLRIGRLKSGVTTWLLLGFGATAIVVVVLMSRAGNRAAPMTASTAPSTTNGPAAAPWAYDSVTKRHYDPGHGHWHDGPPPLSATGGPGTATATTTAPAAAAVPPGPAPAPWTFDRAGNRHWDPTHNHWHPGPPPPGAK